MTIARVQPSLVWTPDRLAVVRDAAASLLGSSTKNRRGEAQADLYWLQGGPHKVLQDGLAVLKGQIEQQRIEDRAFDREDTPLAELNLRRTVYACVDQSDRSSMAEAVARVRGAEASSFVALEHFDEHLSQPEEREVFEECVNVAAEKKCRLIIYARSNVNPQALTDVFGLDNLFSKYCIKIHKYPGSNLIINPIDDDLFREKLIANIGGIRGLHYDIAKEELVDSLITLFHRTADEVNVTAGMDDPVQHGNALVDPISKLRLPPLPRTPYSGRTAKYGKRLSVEEFLEAEWGDYQRHNLLYADHLRVIDYSLYKALYYRARESQPPKTMAEYASDLGILCREHVVVGDPRFSRQIGLLRQSRFLARATSVRQRGAGLTAKNATNG
jgi:hypothetical protein